MSPDGHVLRAHRHWILGTHRARTSARRPPGHRSGGVWGRTAGHADSLARELGAAAYSDLDALLGDVDAVAIAVPPDAQAELAVRAADKGRHLLLDKPLALSADAADRVVAAVDRAGVRNLVFFTLRFTSSVADGSTAFPRRRRFEALGFAYTHPSTSLTTHTGPRHGDRNTARCGTSDRTPCQCSCPSLVR